MNNSLYNKRLELLTEGAKTIGEEVLTSKNGSKYVVLTSVTNRMVQSKIYGGVSRKDLKSYGENISYEKTFKTMILLTKKNKMMIKDDPMAQSFSNLSFGNFRPLVNLSPVGVFQGSKSLTAGLIVPFLKMFLYGKNAEWICTDTENYQYLSYGNLVRSYKSLKELKIDLGYGFLSDSDFRSVSLHNFLMFQNNSPEDNWIAFRGEKLDNFQIEDIKSMETELGYSLPFRSVAKYHDTLMKAINKVKLESIPDTAIELPLPAPLSRINESLPEIEVEWIDNERRLAEEGMLMHHCVGGQRGNLRTKRSLYATVTFKEKPYTLKMDPDSFDIQEFKGRFNAYPPAKLMNFLRDYFNSFK